MSDSRQRGGSADGGSADGGSADRGSAANEPTIRVFDDADAASQAAAVAIAAGLRDAAAVRGRADWATTGGSSPVGIYRALRTPPLRDIVPWSVVHVWWGDDRFVARADRQSNVRPLDREVLPRRWQVPLPPENVHPMPMDAAIAAGAGPDRVAAAYAAELHDAGVPTSAGGFPALDVMLLGVGGDGHLLSVFPGSPLLGSTAWVSAVDAPTHIEPHLPRVSLHPGTIGAAGRVVVVATGEGKAEILAHVLGSEMDLARWPAQLARRAGATWFLDRDAAAQLPR